MMDAVTRTFIGIRVPEPLGVQIEAALSGLKRRPGAENVRWNTRAEFLINLVSLGEIGLATLAQVRQALPAAAATTSPLSLSIKGFGGLPNMMQPRYVVAKLEGDTDALSWLANNLHRAACPYLPSQEAKPFQPHIVVGRLKTESESYRVALGRALKNPVTEDMGVLMVTAVELLVSTAGHHGVSYVLVDQLPLSQS